MTQVLAVFGLLLVIGLPFAAVRWHRRDVRRNRVRARFVEHVDLERTGVIPVIRDEILEQPEGRGRTPDSAAPLRYPVPVPRGPLRAPPTVGSPRTAVAGTGPRDVPPLTGPPVGSPAGGRRAPSSTAELGGDPRTTPPALRAAF